MAQGDQSDFVRRIFAVLPTRWFGDAPPILTAILTGPAAAFALIWSQIQYLILQTRIATATDAWLDGVSTDFFAGALPRLVNETDPAFSLRIRQNLLAPANTRAAVIRAVQNLTSRAPWVFEPANSGDAGGYGTGEAKVWSGLAYNQAGGYGDLSLAFQFFMIAYRPHGGGVAVVGGYSGQESSPEYAPGGYGAGAMEWASASMIQGQVTDDMIRAAIVRVLPAGTDCWLAITS